MGASTMMNKVGCYVGPSSADNKIKFIQNSPCVKAFVDPAALDYARPGAITVFRQFFSHQDIWLNGADVARSVLAALNGRKPTYVQLYNECYQWLSDNLARYVSFHEEAAPVVHEYGIKLAGFGFSTQQPPDETWLYLKAHRYGDCDAIVLNQYHTGDASGPRFNEDSALKHRHVHRLLGDGHPPFLIGECGRDNVEGIAP